jgi:hypothetical protein
VGIMGNMRRRKRGEGLAVVDPTITAETKQPTFEGNPCERCGSTLRLVAGSRCVRCLRQWRRDNEHRYYRKYGGSLFRKLGLTQARYYEMCEAQNWACLVCGTLSVKKLHVDHCHDTNKIRGLLCGDCNIGLGHFKESPERLKKAIAYLLAST